MSRLVCSMLLGGVSALMTLLVFLYGIGWLVGFDVLPAFCFPFDPEMMVIICSILSVTCSSLTLSLSQSDNEKMTQF